MGKTKESKQFTLNDVNNKELVILMLKYEEQLTKSNYGQSLYKNELNNPYTSLTVEKALNRLTLKHFNFDTSDASVENYRLIFKTYYSSPSNYDQDVINSSFYMRNNKCMYYKSKKLNVGDLIVDCQLYNLDGINKMSIHDILHKNEFNYAMLCAFSLS